MTTTQNDRGAYIAATLALLLVLAALHQAPPTAQVHRISHALEFALSLVASVLCLRAVAAARGVGRAFWTMFGLGSLLWASGVALLPSAPLAGANQVGAWDALFAASSVVYVAACGLRPDHPRGWLGVAFDVAILAGLALHTWLYFGVAYVQAEARVPAGWGATLRDGRFALMLACAAWLVQGSRGHWRRIYLGLAAAIVLLFGGSSVLHRALANGLYHPGLWDLPRMLPFLWIGLSALGRAEPAGEAGASAPEWADLRRGTRVALLAIAFIPALEFSMSLAGVQAGLVRGGEAQVQLTRIRAILSLATTALICALLLSRQLHLLRWAERAQREREQALRESEERFSKAFAASPAAMSISTLEEGRYVDVNESYVRLMGLKREDVIGRTSIELGFFDQPEQRQRLVHQLRERGAVSAAPLTVRRPSTGEARDALVSLEPIELGPTSCLLGVVEDVTERRRAEQALLASERRYRLLFERNLAGFFRTTPEGRILECNESLVRILGYGSRHELLERSAVDLYFSRAEREKEMRLLMETGALTTHEVCLRRKDGTPVWIVENEMLVPDEDGPGVVIEGTVIDITERRRAEEETLRLAKMKTNFLVVASHEMRTPLTVLAGYLELLIEDEGLTPEEEERSLKVCQRTVERLTRTFNDILATLQVAGRLTLRRAPLDLRELARQVLEELAPFIERRGQRVQLEAPARLPPVPADPERIHEALSNLVENAIKFTPDAGEIRVRLAVEPGWHRITVEDTGIGIDPEELGSIWERFYAGANPMHHSSGTYEFKARGSGLGLAIAKGYVEAHGGRVGATSGGPGRGAAFTILLPSTAPPATEA